MEVDASNTGVGAVLSQQSEGKMCPCGLSPSEQNYNVGNLELLAVKLGLEKWRDWLEGSKQLFVVWTNHKNLAYLRLDKRLNVRQARWALSFTQFNFHISFHPGSRNSKLDVLSRQFSHSEFLDKPEPILPPACVVGAAIWEVELLVITA